MAKNPRYQAIAITALCIALLKDRDQSVRCSVAEALGEIGSEEAIPTLLQALKDSSPKVRRKVAQAIAKICAPDVRSRLLELIETQIELINNLTSNQPMSETPKYNITNPQSVQIIEHTDGGDVIAHNYATPQNLAEAATEIQELLAQLEKNHPTITAEIIEQEIKQNSTFKARLIHTLKAGGIETVKLLFAPLGIPIEMIRAWVETE